MKEIKLFVGNRSALVKRKNARTHVISLKDDGYIIELKTLSDNTTPRALHRVDKGKIVTTGIKVSVDGAISIIAALQEMLKKDGIL